MMTKPADHPEGLTPFDGGEKISRTDPRPPSPPGGESMGVGVKIFGPAGGGDTPSPPSCVGCGYCCAKAPCHFSMDQ